jgi:aminomethyltransferase
MHRARQILAAVGKQTPLYDFHVQHGGKMVEFAGWSLPVQYNDFGIIDSCLHTRSKASLFDVSHMGQLEIFGRDREAFVESITVGDLAALDIGESRLSLFTNNNGGIIDDTIITKRTDSVQLILNAGCVEKDLEHIQSCRGKFSGDVELVFHGSHSLIALQGPEAMSVLQPLIINVDLSRMPFMTFKDNIEIAGISGCNISRSGYTGEDGFEISIPSDDGVNHLAKKLLEHDAVRLAGLGARDTLRIEAGLCLYGSDITESTTPVEAGLAWTITKRRRQEGGGFPGDKIILDQIKNGARRKRVGLVVQNGPPARHDNNIFDSINSQSVIGITTSGTFSPSLGKAVAMGYVHSEHSAIGTNLVVEVRGKRNPVNVTKMPFVKANYYRIV